jgi:shikimate dehydrogenase
MSTPLLVGLIGHPIGHSRSPAIHQAAFDALGIPARYALWDTLPDELPARIGALRVPGVLGANVSIPHKTAVLPLLDAVDPVVLRQTGAVNTVVSEETSSGIRLLGYNTDVAALQRVLRERDAWRTGRRMLVLGAGGAARAALAVAQSEGAEARIAARHVPRARDMLTQLWSAAGHGALVPREWRAHIVDLTDTGALAAALADTAVLVNATPVGTGDQAAAPLPPHLLRNLPSGSFVFDMVYAPAETALVRAARACDLRASGGLPMLLYQGADAFQLWTHRPAPLGIMQAVLGLEAEMDTGASAT